MLCSPLMLLDGAKMSTCDGSTGASDRGFHGSPRLPEELRRKIRRLQTANIAGLQNRLRNLLATRLP